MEKETRTFLYFVGKKRKGDKWGKIFVICVWMGGWGKIEKNRKFFSYYQAGKE